MTLLILSIRTRILYHQIWNKAYKQAYSYFRFSFSHSVNPIKAISKINNLNLRSIGEILQNCLFQNFTTFLILSIRTRILYYQILEQGL